MDFEDKDILNQRLEPSPGVLYVVGTPIGNLGDLSPRATSLLQKVSVIACEDTRHSGHMLKHIGARATLLSFYQHNARHRLSQLLELLKGGKSLALISDAGLPGISDPGETLVSSARKAGHDVICIPGPCAVTTALVSSGLPSNRFCFEGFLPSKGKIRKELLASIAEENRTTVIYESPHRLVKLLQELNQLCGAERPLQIARELTKLHEEHIGPTIGDALQHFLENKPIGECTLVLGGAPQHLETVQLSQQELVAEMKVLIAEGASSNDAAKAIAQKYGQSKRSLYSLLHDIKTNNGK